MIRQYGPPTHRVRTRRLSDRHQCLFDQAVRCHGRGGAADRLGTAETVIDQLEYGGRGRTDTVERIERTLDVLSAARGAA